MKENVVKQRNSSIELLRIISMLMIIMSHYAVHGGFVLNNMPFGFNKLLLHASVLGNLGVNIFFIISGYFLSKSKFNLKKLLSLIFEVFSYSIIIFIIFSLMDGGTFSIVSLIKNCFPIIFEQYWFATAYVIMYLFFPFMNKLINILSEKEHLKLIGLLLFIWSIMYTAIGTNFYYNNIIDILILYFIAGFIQKYKDGIIKDNYKLIKFCTIASIITLLLLVIALCYLGFDSNFILRYFTKNSIFIIVIAVGIFIIFSNIKLNSKVINKISSCMFGVYLLHDNNYVRNVLWQTILKNYTYQGSNLLIIHMLISIILVFVVCTIIELLRKNTLQKLFNKLVDKFYNSIKEKIVYTINIMTKALNKLVQVVNK